LPNLNTPPNAIGRPFFRGQGSCSLSAAFVPFVSFVFFVVMVSRHRSP